MRIVQPQPVTACVQAGKAHGRDQDDGNGDRLAVRRDRSRTWMVRPSVPACSRTSENRSPRLNVQRGIFTPAFCVKRSPHSSSG